MRFLRLSADPLAREREAMTPDSLLVQIERATYVAWAVTATIALICGLCLRLGARALARLTGMRLLASTVAVIAGLFALVAIDNIRYRIAEAPFEPPAWIDPGVVSLYLPACALICGALVAGFLPSRVDAR